MSKNTKYIIMFGDIKEDLYDKILYYSALFAAVCILGSFGIIMGSVAIKCVLSMI